MSYHEKCSYFTDDFCKQVSDVIMQSRVLFTLTRALGVGGQNKLFLVLFQQQTANAFPAML